MQKAQEFVDKNWIRGKIEVVEVLNEADELLRTGSLGNLMEGCARDQITPGTKQL